MFRRLLSIVAAALIAGSSLLVVAAAHAQSAPADGLAAAALTNADLPGFTQLQDNSPNAGLPGVSGMFVRSFVTADAGGGALVDGLIETEQPLPPGVVVALFGGPTFVQALAGGGVAIQNFQVLTPLGLGDADQQVAFDLPDQKSDMTLHFIADIFVRGRVIALVMDGGPQQPDQSQLAGIVQAQDAKLSAAGLR